MMHARFGRWAHRPAATPPQIVIAIVATAAITAFCALCLMKSYSEQMTHDMSIAIRELGVSEHKDGCTLSYASARPASRPDTARPFAAGDI